MAVALDKPVGRWDRARAWTTLWWAAVLNRVLVGPKPRTWLLAQRDYRIHRAADFYGRSPQGRRFLEARIGLDEETFRQILRDPDKALRPRSVARRLASVRWEYVRETWGRLKAWRGRVQETREALRR